MNDGDSEVMERPLERRLIKKDRRMRLEEAKDKVKKMILGEL